MQDLPLYSTHFLSILCQLLLVYRDSCNTLYRGKEEGREGGEEEGKERGRSEEREEGKWGGRDRGRKERERREGEREKEDGRKGRKDGERGREEGRGWRKEGREAKGGRQREGGVHYNLPPISELTVVAPDGSKGERGMSHESVISSKWARDEDINRMIRYDHTPPMTLYPGNS